VTVTGGPVQVDLPLLTLHITAGDETEESLALDYWDHATDRYDRPAWIHPAKALGERYGSRPGELARRVAGVCTAAFTAQRCTACGEPVPVASRSEVPPKPSGGVCSACRDRQRVERAAQQRAAQAEAERVRHVRQEFIDRRYAVRPDTHTEREIDGLVAGLSLAEALVLAVLLRQAGTDGIVPPIVDWPPAPPIGADRDWSNEVLGGLARTGLVAVHPSVAVDALFWGDDTATETDQWFTYRVPLYAAGTGSLAVRAQRLLTLVTERLTGLWTPAWGEQARALARRLAVDEAVRFFEHSIDLHRLPEPDDGERAVLREVLGEAAGTYSLGQCYAMIWSVTKDGGAAKQRSPYMPGQNATTHAVNRLRAYVRDALARGYTLSVFDVRKDLPLADVTVLLYTDVLRLDPMAALPVPVTDAVAARTLSPDPDEVAEQIIRTGLSAVQVQTVLDIVDEITVSAAYLDSHGELGEAATLAVQLLNRFGLVVDVARESGASVGEAFRAAYHGLLYADALSRDGEQIAFRVQAWLRSAAIDRLDVEQVLTEVAHPKWPPGTNEVRAAE
jgi:hypothetical protein